MISVIIPCYNVALYIDRAIKSVYNQTYRNWELILVNNNSTDDTEIILEKYRQQHPDKIKVLTEFRHGACAARNRGLHEAKGEWIQFLDADDELLSTKLERHLAICVENTTDVVFGAYSRSYGDHEEIIIPYMDNIWIALIKSLLGITSSIFWKKECLLNINGFNENLTSSQEYDLLFRLLKTLTRLAYDLEVSTVVHISENSISRPGNRRKLKSVLLNLLDLRCQIKQYLVDREVFSKEVSLEYNKYLLNILKWYQPSLGYFYLLKIKCQYKINGKLEFPIIVALRSFRKKSLKIFANNKLLWKK